VSRLLDFGACGEKEKREGKKGEEKKKQ